MNRGLFRRGNRRAASTTPEQVVWIRDRYNDPIEPWTQSRLARYTGLSVGQIGRIVRGECWQNVEGMIADRQEAITRRNLLMNLAPEVDIPKDLQELLKRADEPAADPAPPKEDAVERYLRRNK